MRRKCQGGEGAGGCGANECHCHRYSYKVVFIGSCVIILYFIGGEFCALAIVSELYDFRSFVLLIVIVGNFVLFIC